ncbi:hypothetical protein NF27_CD00180, partial [Candidatus Jidaibacter acanthamoeba]
MGVVLDTCIIIASEKQKLNFDQFKDYGEVYISAITASELLIGV